ncbi:Cysteine protease ATG4B [Dichanthelium oligosanthes]|uniref:Cysteine protease n=1 Tax=Dichanthelium oligosanthes TaxID=888268 RepID=A0A1E5UVD2_9POAL|nr:Cysteine protease ATG4B [Dichanthelium oligosanthes]
MTSLPERGEAPPSDSSREEDAAPAAASSSSSEHKEDSSSKQSKPSILSGVFTPPFTIFEGQQDSTPTCEKKSPKSSSGSYGWSRILRRFVASSSMWRLLGCAKVLTSSDVWFLGKCYKVSPEESSSDSDSETGHAAFLEDFSSRIWITYRKGWALQGYICAQNLFHVLRCLDVDMFLVSAFDAISDSKLTSDVNWGCMVRSSQMLVAQVNFVSLKALIFHHLGRSWRKAPEKPYNPEYIGVLHLFGDSEACAFSIHNLLQAGKSYGLAARSWVGPYAMCRAWQTLIRTNREQADAVGRKENFPMALYVVSGDEDGERGGAPVVCIDVAAQLCSDFNKGQSTWSPILLLVPLVLGLDKINPRQLTLHRITWRQTLPHTTAGMCTFVVRDLALDQIDPSLAIGFYCRDKDDFDDFCSRASELVEKANGAPLFTVVQSIEPSKQMYKQDDGLGCSGSSMANDNDLDGSGEAGEEEWQIL